MLRGFLIVVQITVVSGDINRQVVNALFAGVIVLDSAVRLTGLLHDFVLSELVLLKAALTAKVIITVFVLAWP